MASRRPVRRPRGRELSKARTQSAHNWAQLSPSASRSTSTSRARDLAGKLWRGPQLDITRRRLARRLVRWGGGRPVEGRAQFHDDATVGGDHYPNNSRSDGICNKTTKSSARLLRGMRAMPVINHWPNGLPVVALDLFFGRRPLVII
jgi:hypothetical protein